MSQILLVAAAKFEAEQTLTLLEKNNIETSFVECGIGAITAAKNSTFIAQAASNKHTIFIGSCGVFENFNHNKVEIISVDLIEWMPVGVREKQAELINSAYPPILIEAQNSDPANLKTLLCTTSITTANHTKLPNRLVAENTYENLELYSIAAEIIKSAHSFKNFLAITNQIGSLGRKQWKENHQAAAQATAQTVLNHIKKTI